VSQRRIFSPRPLAISGAPNPALERREVEAITAILRREGPLSTRELRRRVDARLWGPGRFGAALARARTQGLVRRVGRGTYAAVTNGQAPPRRTA
jgi:hypothetical protein